MLKNQEGATSEVYVNNYTSIAGLLEPVQKHTTLVV